MDNNAVSVDSYHLTLPSRDHAARLLSWFDALQEMIYWGGPGMVFPVGLEQHYQVDSPTGNLRF